jgi:hypothetical protein
MTNEERREALNRARKEAYDHALKAELAVDGVTRQGHGEMAKVWAAVAEAMKDGDPVHDAPDGRPSTPSPVLSTEYGVITR